MLIMVILFDGVCNLCNGLVKFIIKRDKKKRFVTLLNEPKFEKYQDFKEMLHLLASNNCKGCRQEQCHLFKNCKVRDCYKTKGIDYCFLCNCFPCNNTGFDDNLQNRWLTINRRIKEIGLENYYNEIKDKPRY